MVLQIAERLFVRKIAKYGAKCAFDGVINENLVMVHEINIVRYLNKGRPN